MKKLGLGLLILLSLGIFSCEDENSELLERSPIDLPSDGGGEEDEDDPVNSGGSQ